MKQRILFPILLLLLLCNCGSKRTGNLFDSWIQQEAKLYDVPILIDAQPDDTNKQPDSLSQVSFFANVDFAEAILFYEQEMERFGWNLLGSFIEDEALLVFDKPTKMCSVSIRPSKKHVRVVIFLKSKK